VGVDGGQATWLVTQTQKAAGQPPLAALLRRSNNKPIGRSNGFPSTRIFRAWQARTQPIGRSRRHIRWIKLGWQTFWSYAFLLYFSMNAQSINFRGASFVNPHERPINQFPMS